ncbi:MAG: hypothetical protein JSU73_11675 [candidate division WOR-3 bacterium]|nr:MAG: hypothetical protein JSU73_11675 [candidate division WOR-3 bacterium]
MRFENDLVVKQPQTDLVYAACLEMDVASNGEDFLVVWSQWIRGQTPDWDWHVRGRIVHSDGSTGPFVEIDVNDEWNRWPAVSFNGTHYLVSWYDPSKKGVRAVRVTTGGDIVGPEVAVADGPYRPCLASEGGRTLAVWGETQTAGGPIHARYIENDMAMGDPFLVTNENAKEHAVGYGGGTYLVAWCVDNLMDIHGRVVHADGSPLGPIFNIDAYDQSENFPAVAFGNTNYLATWMDFDHDPDQMLWKTKGRRVSPSSMTVGPEEFPYPVHTDQYEPDLASDGETFVVIWRDKLVPPVQDRDAIMADTISSWQRHFYSTWVDATAPNQARNIALDPTTGYLHKVYTSGDSVLYSYSTDSGVHWFPFECVMRGVPLYYPCIVAEAGLVWVCFREGSNRLWCGARLGPNDWEQYWIYDGEYQYEVSAPSMSLCHENIGPTDPPGVHVVFSRECVSGGLYESWTEYRKVLLHEGVVYDTTVDNHGPTELPQLLRTPSVATTPGDIVHVVWAYEDAWNCWSRIRYNQRAYGVWLPNYEEPSWDILYPYAEPAFYPCVEAYGDFTYAVWKGRDNNGNDIGDIWRRRRLVDALPWRDTRNISRTENKVSLYPQYSTSEVGAWQEAPNSHWDLWGSIGDKVVTIYESDPNSQFPSIVAELPPPGEIGTLIRTLWTEEVPGGEPAPYEVKYTCYEDIPTDETTEYAYYDCGVGDSTPSRFCLARDGFAKWRGFSVDYAREKLRYRLPYLNPHCVYWLRSVHYHATKDTWSDGFSLDGVQVGKYQYRPLTPETVWVTIPRALYERDCEVTLDVARLAGEYSAVAELKLFEIYPYRLRGEDGGPQSGPVWKPLSQVVFDNLTPTLFRHGALIRYSVLTPQAVDLRIYDVQGRLVRNLACGAHKPGSYDAHWDGTDERGKRVPSGTYFCRLTSAEAQVARKVVLAE